MSLRSQTLLLLLVATTACRGGNARLDDGGTPEAPDMAGGNSTARITITGALSGSEESTGPVGMSWDLNDITGLLFTQQSGPIFTTNAILTFRGPPTAC